jgi:hypothetical protein
MYGAHATGMVSGVVAYIGRGGSLGVGWGLRWWWAMSAGEA